MSRSHYKNTLEYASPGARGRRFWVRATIVWAIPIWGWVIYSVLILPRFERVFMDFKVSLPLISQVTLDFGRWVRTYWIVALPVMCLPGLVPLLVGTSDPQTPGTPNAQSKVVYWLGFLFMLLVVLLAIAAVMLPMLTLIGAVSGGTGKK